MNTSMGGSIFVLNYVDVEQQRKNVWYLCIFEYISNGVATKIHKQHNSKTISKHLNKMPMKVHTLIGETVFIITTT